MPKSKKYEKFDPNIEIHMPQMGHLEQQQKQNVFQFKSDGWWAQFTFHSL